MIFELLHAPYASGYGEALLPLATCKEQLKVEITDDDDLIAILRDAALEFVERYCSLRLKETTGLIWKAERFPCAGQSIKLGVGPVSAITAIEWLDGDGATVNGTLSDYRLGLHNEVLPAIGGSWPSDVGGGVQITFTAGYADDAAPSSLLQAARMFLGHLYKFREAVTDRGTEAEVPFGVRQLCSRFRGVVI